MLLKYNNKYNTIKQFVSRTVVDYLVESEAQLAILAIVYFNMACYYKNSKYFTTNFVYIG